MWSTSPKVTSPPWRSAVVTRASSRTTSAPARDTAVLEVIAAYERQSGKPIPYEIVGRRAGDVAANWADVGEGAPRLGWETSRDLDDMCSDSLALAAKPSLTEAFSLAASVSEVPINDLIRAAQRWIEGDPEARTREGALQSMVEAGDQDGLSAAMGEPLTFGTAGIRGEVGPGSSRMNRATVIRTTRGLAEYLIARHEAPRSGLSP